MFFASEFWNTIIMKNISYDLVIFKLNRIMLIIMFYVH